MVTKQQYRNLPVDRTRDLLCLVHMRASIEIIGLCLVVIIVTPMIFSFVMVCEKSIV